MATTKRKRRYTGKTAVKNLVPLLRMMPDEEARAEMTVRQIFEAWLAGNSIKPGEAASRLGISRQAMNQMLRYHDDPENPNTRPPSPTLIAAIKAWTGGWEMPGALPKLPKPPELSNVPGKGRHRLETNPPPTVAATGSDLLPGEEEITSIAGSPDPVSDEERAAILAAAAGGAS